MIDPVSTQFIPQNLVRPPAAEQLEAGALRSSRALAQPESGDAAKGAGSFFDLVGGLVNEVDAKSKVAEAEVRKLMLGESDNIHQSMISMQESGLAFNLLVEVCNKLVESYQELMRMPV